MQPNRVGGGIFWSRRPGHGPFGATARHPGRRPARRRTIFRRPNMTNRRSPFLAFRDFGNRRVSTAVRTRDGRSGELQFDFSCAATIVPVTGIDVDKPPASIRKLIQLCAPASSSPASSVFGPCSCRRVSVPDATAAAKLRLVASPGRVGHWGTCGEWLNRLPTCIGNVQPALPVGGPRA